jgi:hypothetical protein
MGFVLIGKIAQILEVLTALAELEWEFPTLAAQLDGKIIDLRA